jgi:hypothetical protein
LKWGDFCRELYRGQAIVVTGVRGEIGLADDWRGNGTWSRSLGLQTNIGQLVAVLKQLAKYTD